MSTLKRKEKRSFILDTEKCHFIPRHYGCETPQEGGMGVASQKVGMSQSCQLLRVYEYTSIWDLTAELMSRVKVEVAIQLGSRPQ